MDVIPPNLRYVDSCFNCDYATIKSVGCWCHRYQMMTDDKVVCDDFSPTRKIVLKLVNPKDKGE